MRNTVLIVDGNVRERVIARALIQSRGIPAYAAEDGTEAWEMLVCDCRTFALLIIDLAGGSSGMNGWELLRSVRGRFGGLPLARRPQIAVMLPHGRPEAARFARRLGAQVVLRKPLVPSDFIAAVEDSSAAHSPRPW